jgi:hypothetical protein
MLITDALNMAVSVVLALVAVFAVLVTLPCSAVCQLKNGKRNTARRGFDLAAGHNTGECDMTHNLLRPAVAQVLFARRLLSDLNNDIDEGTHREKQVETPRRFFDSGGHAADGVSANL